MKSPRHSYKPLIGITPDTANEEKSGEPLLWLRQRYARAVAAAGGIPVILPVALSTPSTREILARLDGLVVSGGGFDIHPRHYGERALPELDEVKSDRTEFELELIRQALGRDLPLLGICGGAQAINVVLGGTLYQDIPSQIGRALNHRQLSAKEYGGHSVEIHAGTLLRRIVGKRVIEVNTNHHQSLKRLGRGLKINAVAPDGVVEGLESAGHSFVLGVQWHPEFLAPRRAAHKKIFTALVSASRKVGR